MGRSVLVTGGARGIGRVLVRRFLELGDKVVVFDIIEDELEHCVKKHLKQYHDKKQVSGLIVDLRDPKAIRENVKKAAEFLGGRIDVLINNGGIASPQWKDGATMADPDTLEQWQAYIDTNLTSPFVASQAVIPYMKIDADHQRDTSAAGPCILHIGSFRAHRSDPNQEGYASSKAGQLGLMHSMAISLSQFGIRVNLIAPGRIKVAHECKDGDEKGTEWAELNEEKDIGDHPTNRAGRPKDIADAAEYLVEAGFVTGQELIVDGGAVKKKA